MPAFRRSVPAEEREQLAVQFATLEAELTAQEYARPGTVPLADRDPEEFVAANSYPGHHRSALRVSARPDGGGERWVRRERFARNRRPPGYRVIGPSFTLRSRAS